MDTVGGGDAPVPAIDLAAQTKLRTGPVRTDAYPTTNGHLLAYLPEYPVYDACKRATFVKVHARTRRAPGAKGLERVEQAPILADAHCQVVAVVVRGIEIRPGPHKGGFV